MKRKFLSLFGGVVAAFAAQNALSTTTITPSTPSHISAALPLRVIAPVEQGLALEASLNDLSFVLKNSNQTGVMMAGHSSHRSHSSHSSHRSHYSSR